MKLAVALSLISAAHAWPLFGRNNDKPAPGPGPAPGPVPSPPSKGEHGVRIRNEASHKCLAPGDTKDVKNGTKVVVVDCKDAPVWLLPDGYDWDDDKYTQHDGKSDKDGKDRKYASGPIRPKAYPDLALSAGEKAYDGGHLFLYTVNGKTEQE